MGCLSFSTLFFVARVITDLCCVFLLRMGFFIENFSEFPWVRTFPWITPLIFLKRKVFNTRVEKEENSYMTKCFAHFFDVFPTVLDDVSFLFVTKSSEEIGSEKKQRISSLRRWHVTSLASTPRTIFFHVSLTSFCELKSWMRFVYPVKLLNANIPELE